MKICQLKRYLGVVLLGLSSVAHATLIGVLPITPGSTDYQAYYDPVADLTWLANANVNGIMDWPDAISWAASLNIGGVTGWTLPTSDSCLKGYNCTGSEMGNLYYNVLGNLGLCNAGGICGQPRWGLKNTGPFSNLQPYDYWSSTPYLPNTSYAWRFDFDSGYQDVGYAGKTTNGLFAWAVHTGKVTAIPEPGTLLLMGIGAIGAAIRRKYAFPLG